MAIGILDRHEIPGLDPIGTAHHLFELSATLQTHILCEGITIGGLNVLLYRISVELP